jgi:peptide/nickel transport system substrate-binding protein
MERLRLTRQAGWICRRLTWAIVLVSAVGAMGAAAAPASNYDRGSKPGPTGGQTMTIGMQFPWTTLDQQTTGLDDQVSWAAYDRLVAFGTGNKVVPYLAKSWVVTPRSVTFKLRTDATCSDGTRVTPTVVLNSFKRLFNPKTSAPLRAKFFGPGPYTVSANTKAHTFTLKVGTAYDLLSSFAHPAAGIICPAGLAHPTDLATHMFGSGPYTLTSVVPGSSVTFKLRPNWKWGPKGTTSRDLPEKLVLKVVANQTTAANLLLTGGLDIGSVSGPDVSRLKANRSLKLQFTSNFEVHPIYFNQAAGHITTDIAVRKAVATAFDPAVWNKLANFGYGTVSSSLFTASAHCFDPKTAALIPKYSIANARAVLIADGYTLSNGVLVKNGQPLKILLTSYPGFFEPAAAEYIAAELKLVGMDVTLNTTDLGTWYGDLVAGKWDVTIIPTGPNFFPSFAQGSSWIGGISPSAGGQNFADLQDQTLANEKLAALNATGKASCQHWAAFQERLLTQYYLVPTAAAQYLWFSKKNISYFAINTFVELYSIRVR